MDSLLSTVSSYITMPVQIVILIIMVSLIKRFILSKTKLAYIEPKVEELPPMKKRDFTIEELRKYNGKDNERILIAVNGKVFDVTAGKSFYGPDGPYSLIAGRDGSRSLATFSMHESAIKDEYDDLSDLNSMQMESVSEWENQFNDKYTLLGKLLKPGEKHNNYQAEESEDELQTEAGKKFD